MKLFISLVTSSLLFLNSFINNDTNTTSYPKTIDGLIIAYDAMYKAPENFHEDYIILDMESWFFIETTYEERKKMIEHFNQYNKTIVNASLFKLKEIGLAEENGKLNLNGIILMIKEIKSSKENEVVMVGYKYRGPLGIDIYEITMKIEENKWVLKSIKPTGMA